MFENIIGNQSVISILTRELSDNVFPQSVLFAGEAFSGKLSTALEIARVLTCEQKADWSCRCSTCEQHRLLLHSYTVLTGFRSFRAEIRAAEEVLVRTKTTAAHFVFLRAVRKLTRRFDPHIFYAEDSRRKEIQDILENLEESLTLLSPPRGLPEGKNGSKLLETAKSLAAKLEGYLPRDNIPVTVVRNISQWAYLTTPSAKKIVIIENASRMLDASRNALLKILEEPPPDMHFILLSERPGEIIPTIRSRLRLYRFPVRSSQEQREVLARIFKEENPEYETLKEYFLAWEDIHISTVRLVAKRFLEKLLAPGMVVIQNEIPELFIRDTPREFYRSFLEELVASFRAYFPDGTNGNPSQALPLRRLESWTRLIRGRLREFSTLNLSPALFIESLFLTMKEET